MGSCFNPESEDRSNLKTRGCTDITWLTIYVTLWILMIIIATFAFVYGNPMRLMHGYDSFGNTCGSSTNEDIGNLSGLDLSSKPYVFFLDVTNIKHCLQICVESCPNVQIESIDELRSFYKRTGSNLCRYDFNVLERNKEDLAHGLNESLIVSSPLGPCPVFPVSSSVPVLNRCIPDRVKTSIHSLLKSWDVAEQFLSDIYSVQHLMAALCILALVLSSIMLILFYVVPEFVGCIILISVSTFAIVGTGVLWWTYHEMENDLKSFPILEYSISNKGAFLTYSIIASLITIIILVLVFFLKSKVSFLVTLFEESAECLGALPLLYTTPIFSFIQLMFFYAFWISVIVFLASARYPGIEEIRPFSNTSISSSQMLNEIPRADLPEPLTNISVQNFKTFTRIEFTEGPWVRYMWWIYLVGLVWVSEFTLACQQMVIAGAVAKWYFDGKKIVGKEQPVWMSIKSLICYHLGSVVLGSLLITIFKLPRVILKFFYDGLLRRNKEKCCVDCGVKSCVCCFYCFEHFIRYINHNAYTVVAVQGIDFCPAASRAWTVLANNPLRVATYNIVGDLVLFLGKALITAVSGLVALIIFREQSGLHFCAAPTLLISVFAFFIAHCVISVYEIVIDTLYLCICEDKDINEENGVWKSSALVNIKNPTSEMSPMNRN